MTAEDGTTVYVEAVVTAGDEGLTLDRLQALDLKALADLVPVMSQNIISAVQHTKPSKISAELGLKLTAGTGGALKWVVDVSGEANITIGLEWAPSGTTP